MATPEQTRLYGSQQRDVVALAQAALVGFWRTLDPTNAAATTAAMQAFMVDLVDTYGTVGASIAADYYDELRAGATARGAYAAVMADALPAEQVQAATRWAVGPLFSQTPRIDDTLSQLGGVTQRLVQQAGRDTIALNVDRDPSNASWARMLTGSTNCAFCVLLSSRGAAYRSAESAGQGNHWHAHCDCTQVPVWDDSDLPYDPEPLLNQYLDGRDAADSGDVSKILAGMRETHGLR